MRIIVTITLAFGIGVVGCNGNAPAPVPEATSIGTDTIVTMDPKDFLFTTPTLNDAIPATIKGLAAPADCIQLHEDDWRQFEFIPRSRRRDVEAELADISAIWDRHSVSLGDAGTAFKKVHVRERIPIALAIPMRLADFESFVGQKAKPLVFSGYKEVLRDVHAAAIDKLIVYAEIHEDSVTAFGVDAAEPFSLPPDFAKRLGEFVRTHDLMLVHWRSRTLLDSYEDVMRYFGAGG